MRLACLILAAATCLGGALSPAHAAPPPVIKLDAEVGELPVGRGKLKVGVSGQYINGTLEPEVRFDLHEPHVCDYEFSPDECGSTSNSNGYANVQALLDALAAAESHLGRGQSFDLTLGRAKEDCRCVERGAFQGTVRVEPKVRKAYFSFGSAKPIALGPEELATLRGHVQLARDLIAHLRPQLDAFNATKPDANVPIDLDLIGYYLRRGGQ